MVRKLFGKGKSRADDVQVDAQADELLENWYQHKQSKLDAVLGKADERVLHFMIADPDRGPFDTVFYRNDVPGTGYGNLPAGSLGRNRPVEFGFPNI